MRWPIDVLNVINCPDYIRWRIQTMLYEAFSLSSHPSGSENSLSRFKQVNLQETDLSESREVDERTVLEWVLKN